MVFVNLIEWKWIQDQEEKTGCTLNKVYLFVQHGTDFKTLYTRDEVG